jgi:thiol-disulfide isomerase/thioredoxin
MKKLTLLGIITAIILALLISGCTDNGDDNGNGGELETAPDFTLKSTDNDYFSLSDFSGKVVILDFMFIDCAPCIVEMGHLENVSLNYSGNQVKIISIDVNYMSETEDDLKNFKENNGYEWTFAMDTETENVKSKYQPSAFPTLVVVNKQGKIAYKHIGVANYEIISSKIDELL